MSDLTDLARIMWDDFKAPDVSYTERVVFFSVLITVIAGAVGLFIYAA